MIKVVALETFSLKDFNKIEELKRKDKSQDGILFKGDTFKCDEKMCEYLTGKNPLNRAVVQVIEIKPEEKPEEIKEETQKVEIKQTAKNKKKKNNKK